MPDVPLRPPEATEARQEVRLRRATEEEVCAPGENSCFTVDELLLPVYIRRPSWDGDAMVTARVRAYIDADGAVREAHVS
jgi:hypothetical protein